MTAPVLPTAEEALTLAPQRGSVVWRYAGDSRLLATAGYALILQVAHPTVGAGVTEHSDFKRDPWGRLFRTLDYTYSLSYGGPVLAREIGARVREMHKHIKGVKPDGERYHALEPTAYTWVHATLFEAIMAGHRVFGRRMSPAEVEQFYAEWRVMGRLVGVRLCDMPETVTEFRLYFDRMVADVLEDNQAVRDVLFTLTRPASPPVVPPALAPAWRALRFPAGRALALATVGLLPPLLRERLGVEWAPSQERQLRGLGAVARSLTPVLPKSLRNAGPAYLKWRRKAIARGDVASPSRAPSALAA